MEKILYTQLTIINILVLAVVWYGDVYRSRGPLMISQKVFRILIWVNVVTMLCDLVQVLYDGTMFWYSGIIENISIFKH